jgi:DNA-directed RNA polymerase subunit omega
MRQPSVEVLIERAGSRYAAVVLVAARARQLSAGANRLVDTDARGAVAVALDELATGKLLAGETASISSGDNPTDLRRR